MNEAFNALVDIFREYCEVAQEDEDLQAQREAVAAYDRDFLNVRKDVQQEYRRRARPQASSAQLGDLEWDSFGIRPPQTNRLEDPENIEQVVLGAASLNLSLSQANATPHSGGDSQLRGGAGKLPGVAAFSGFSTPRTTTEPEARLARRADIARLLVCHKMLTVSNNRCALLVAMREDQANSS